MSIEKCKPSFEEGATLRKRAPFTQLYNKVIQTCTNMEAIAVWAYLQSQCDNWVLSPIQLQNHFGIGKDKIYNILTYMINSKLLIRHVKRSDRGLHICTTYTILDGIDFIEPERPVKENRPENRPLPDLPDPVNKDIKKEREIKKKEEDLLKPFVDLKKSTDYKDDDLFMQVYSVFPNKQKPKVAWKAFQKHKPDQTFVDFLVNDIRLRIENNWKGRPKDKIPHPATYFNASEWEGEIYAPESNITQFPNKPARYTMHELGAVL
jgi:hypothetical protein